MTSSQSLEQSSELGFFLYDCIQQIIYSIMNHYIKMWVCFYRMQLAISETRIIPSVATIILEKSFLNPLGWSWQSE